ncbi:hypothetical protein QMZ05_11350 [Bradyrhizobium sp. INPA03-11B]|uniref:hypothetical protein n=1 Tax=Bradyrhizobium sp. INPA03-11B TaxID=418598 RepID=UPI00338E44CD
MLSATVSGYPDVVQKCAAIATNPGFGRGGAMRHMDESPQQQNLTLSIREARAARRRSNLPVSRHAGGRATNEKMRPPRSYPAP